MRAGNGCKILYASNSYGDCGVVLCVGRLGHSPRETPHSAAFVGPPHYSSRATQSAVILYDRRRTQPNHPGCRTDAPPAQELHLRGPDGLVASASPLIGTQLL